MALTETPKHTHPSGPTNEKLKTQLQPPEYKNHSHPTGGQHKAMNQSQPPEGRLQKRKYDPATYCKVYHKQ